MVAKAEHLPKGANPRFVVTSLAAAIDARTLYEDVYCARGEVENRIKVAMASACPYQTEYHLAYLYLRRAAAF